MKDIVNEKKQLRSEVKAKRKLVSAVEHEQLSLQLSHLLIKYIARQNIKAVKGFIPYAGEPNLWPFIHYCWDNDIAYIVPRCELNTSTMTWYRIKHEDGLIKGAYQIMEPNPANCECITDETEIVLVPGLAFTKKGERLGYGGGYYDRFYEQVNNQVNQWIGISFEDFIYASLPIEKHDFKCNYIVTNAGVIDCKVEEKEDYNGIHTF